MSAKCMHRLNDGSFCKRYASAGTRFCSHHQGSYAHLQHSESFDIHPLARLTTPEDLFDLIRETLNAARLGRIPPAQAVAVAALAREWRKSYQELTMLQRMTALHRQILPDLMLDETQAEAERAEAPHPLPVRADEGATVAHMSRNPDTPPLEHISTYPGWIEQEGRRKGDRPASSAPPQPVAAAPAPDLQSALQGIESQPAAAQRPVLPPPDAQVRFSQKRASAQHNSQSPVAPSPVSPASVTPAPAAQRHSSLTPSPSSLTPAPLPLTPGPSSLARAPSPLTPNPSPLAPAPVNGSGKKAHHRPASP